MGGEWKQDIKEVMTEVFSVVLRVAGVLSDY